MKNLTIAFAVIATLALPASSQDTKPSANSTARTATRTERTDTTTRPVLKRGMPAEQGAPLAAEGSTNQMLASGTAIRFKLETPLSTETNSRGDAFHGRVIEAVKVNGRTLIPVGTGISGRVVKVTAPRRIKGLPTIELQPQKITMPSGEEFSLNAVVVDTATDSGTTVNDEGQIKGSGRDRRDNYEMAAATGAGAVIGGMANGGKGLLIGSAIGATASVVRWMSRTKNAELAEGTEIVMELDRPLTLVQGGAAGQ